jgi:hypothetical protein
LIKANGEIGRLIVEFEQHGRERAEYATELLTRLASFSDATNAKFSGDDILITTSKGKSELIKENGSLIRTL